MSRSGGRILVDQLAVHGADLAFCVPGESYLAVLDALYESPVRLIVCRHEGGAANMADAYGKLTGRPGTLIVSPYPEGDPGARDPVAERAVERLRALVTRVRNFRGERRVAPTEPVALSAFGLTAAETERLFSAYDEDYHISRFFHFSESGGQKFAINGFPATHVSLDAEIETIL